VTVSGDTLREFLARCVPWPVQDGPGFINLHWLRPGLRDPSKMVWSGKAVRSPVDFISNAAWGTKQVTIKDQYFCLSLQSHVNKSKRGAFLPARSQANVISLRSLWIDIDVTASNKAGKGYPTTADAVDALQAFITAKNIPTPSAVVASGSGGIHVYWFGTKDLSLSEWQPLANGLKQAILDFGLKCDAGCTVDSARVLRVPGTLNYKHDPPRDVKLLKMNPPERDYDLPIVFQHLSAATAISHSPAAKPAFDLTNFPKREGVVESLSEGIDREVHLLDWVPIYKECAFIRDALTTGGKDYSQPEWNLSTLAATFLEDGHALAHRMGNKHPGYTRDSTNDLWDRKIRERQSRGLGWPSCSAIQTAGCGSCATCPHLAAGKSPLHLGVPVTPPPGVASLFTAAVTPAPPQLYLPDGFALDADGIICKVVEVQEKGAPPVKELLKLFFCKLSAPYAEANFVLNFTATIDAGNQTKIRLPMKEIPGFALCSTLSGQGITYYPPNKRFLEEFFMAWIAKLYAAQASVVSRPLGWFEPNGVRSGFIYGGTVYHTNGTMQSAGAGDPKTSATYMPVGQLAPWIAACDMVLSENRPELAAIIATAFAAPLMKLADQVQVTTSVWGESGGRKTSATEVAQAVWGHPKMCRDTAYTTARSAIERMGHIKHLPLYWDEIKGEKEQEACLDVAFGAEGLGPGRLYPDGRQKDKAEWQTMLIICSNVSFVDHVVKKHPTHAAGLLRVFEFRVHKPADTAPGVINFVDASKLVQDLHSNYGLMGIEYAKLLASDPDGITDFVSETQKSFMEEVQAQADERRWVAACGTMIAGATLATRLGVKFNVPALHDFLVTEFRNNRARIIDEGVDGGSLDNTEEALANFLNLSRNNSVWTDTAHLGAGKPTKKDVVVVHHGPRPDLGHPIYIQWVKNERLLRIERKVFLAHLAKTHVASRIVMVGLREHYRMERIRGCLCINTPYRCLPQPLLHIPVPAGSFLEEIMNTYGEIVEPVRPAYQPPAPTASTKPVVAAPAPTDAFSRAAAVAANDLGLVRRMT